MHLTPAAGWTRFDAKNYVARGLSHTSDNIGIGIDDNFCHIVLLEVLQSTILFQHIIASKQKIQLFRIVLLMFHCH